jgi:hypothetical protein
MARNAPDRFPDLESLIHALEPFLHDTLPARDSTKFGSKRLRSSSSSPVSTPFTAESQDDPALVGRGNGRSAVYIALALVAVGVVWLAVEKLRSPDVTLVAPSPGKWHRSTKSDAASGVWEVPPAPAAPPPEKAERPAQSGSRRARSGPLSVDEF